MGLRRRRYLRVSALTIELSSESSVFAAGLFPPRQDMGRAVEAAAGAGNIVSVLQTPLIIVVEGDPETIQARLRAAGAIYVVGSRLSAFALRQGGNNDIGFRQYRESTARRRPICCRPLWIMVLVVGMEAYISSGASSKASRPQLFARCSQQVDWRFLKMARLVDRFPASQ